MIRLIVDICLIVGAIFALAGVVGVIRMPDVFCRMQASTCIATLGILGVVIGSMFYAAGAGMEMSTVIRILLIGLLVLLTNPISSHALLKGAYKNGDLPEANLVCDDYKEDFTAEPEVVLLNSEEVQE